MSVDDIKAQLEDAIADVARNQARARALRAALDAARAEDPPLLVAQQQQCSRFHDAHERLMRAGAQVDRICSSNVTKPPVPQAPSAMIAARLSRAKAVVALQKRLVSSALAADPRADEEMVPVDVEVEYMDPAVVSTHLVLAQRAVRQAARFRTQRMRERDRLIKVRDDLVAQKADLESRVDRIQQQQQQEQEQQ